jgi:lipid-binding SYLF domain-containing protein
MAGRQLFKKEMEFNFLPCVSVAGGTHMKKLILALALLCLLPFAASAENRKEERANIQRMQSDVLARLYRAHPGAEKEIAHAAGYAVFNSSDVAALFVSGSFGHGIAHNNRTGRETYMKMAAAGVGLGLGIKNFRAVFIFNNQDAYHDFVTTGLDLSGHADAIAKRGARGRSITGAADILPGVRVYQLTDTGLLAQVMLKGTKYWRDEDLNGYDRSSEVTRYRYNQ